MCVFLLRIIVNIVNARGAEMLLILYLVSKLYKKTQSRLEMKDTEYPTDFNRIVKSHWTGFVM